MSNKDALLREQSYENFSFLERTLIAGITRQSRCLRRARLTEHLSDHDKRDHRAGHGHGMISMDGIRSHGCGLPNLTNAFGKVRELLRSSKVSHWLGLWAQGEPNSECCPGDHSKFVYCIVDRRLLSHGCDSRILRLVRAILKHLWSYPFGSKKLTSDRSEFDNKTSNLLPAVPELMVQNFGLGLTLIPLQI